MLGTALVVDSDYFFVEYLGELLEKRGYRVLKAYNGKQGVGRLQQGPVDILFADLVLPKIDGRKLFDFARRRFNGSGFPLVAVSGVIVEHLEDLERIGADCYIAKGPLDKLSARIEAFLNDIESRSFFPGSAQIIWETGDVFPRREAVGLLHELQFQQAVVESLATGVLVVDTDTRIIHANPSACQILSDSAAGCLNRPLLDFFPVKERNPLAKALKASRRDPASKSRVLTFQRGLSMLKLGVSPLIVASEMAGWTVTLEVDDFQPDAVGSAP
jgi:DNA-binding response OmpR family regulator